MKDLQSVPAVAKGFADIGKPGSATTSPRLSSLSQSFLSKLSSKANNGSWENPLKL
jgi:hypothetical protein